MLFFLFSRGHLKIVTFQNREGDLHRKILKVKFRCITKMISCDLCKKTFSRMQSLDRHNASKMHEIRSSTNTIKYTCACGKFYLHQQSVRNHKMKCTFVEAEPIIPPRSNFRIVPPTNTRMVEVKTSYMQAKNRYKPQYKPF